VLHSVWLLCIDTECFVPEQARQTCLAIAPTGEEALEGTAWKLRTSHYAWLTELLALQHTYLRKAILFTHH
jgi:hypothetical protein